MVDGHQKSTAGPPRLRCPACSSSVEMPAEKCPRCNVNLRTAYLKPPRKGFSRMAPAARAGLMMMAIVALAGVATVWEPSAEPEPPPLAEAEDVLPPLRVIKGAPPNFWRLAAEHPVLLRPYILVYEARAAVMETNERFERRQRLLEELEGVMVGLEVQSEDDMYSIFVKMPPGLRGQMLQELDNIYGNPVQP